METNVAEERLGDCPERAVGARCQLQVRLGLYPIVTFEKQLPNMIGNLV